MIIRRLFQSSVNITGNGIPIKLHNIYQPHITFGHWKAPTGQHKTQFAESLSKAKTISKRIFRTNVNRKESHMLFESIMRASIEYPLGQ